MFNLTFIIMKRKYLFLSALVIGIVMASCANNAEGNETVAFSSSNTAEPQLLNAPLPISFKPEPKTI